MSLPLESLNKDSTKICLDKKTWVEVLEKGNITPDYILVEIAEWQDNEIRYNRGYTKFYDILESLMSKNDKIDDIFFRRIGELVFHLDRPYDVIATVTIAIGSFLSDYEINIKNAVYGNEIEKDIKKVADLTRQKALFTGTALNLFMQKEPNDINLRRCVSLCLIDINTIVKDCGYLFYDELKMLSTYKKNTYDYIDVCQEHLDEITEYVSEYKRSVINTLNQTLLLDLSLIVMSYLCN